MHKSVLVASFPTVMSTDAPESFNVPMRLVFRAPFQKVVQFTSVAMRPASNAFVPPATQPDLGLTNTFGPHTKKISRQFPKQLLTLPSIALALTLRLKHRSFQTLYHQPTPTHPSLTLSAASHQKILSTKILILALPKKTPISLHS